MRMQSISHSDPETLFVSVYNGASAQMPIGYVPYWDLDPTLADSRLGNQVNIAIATAAQNLGRAAGVVAKRIIEGGGYGWVQVYGYHAAVRATGYATAPLGTLLQNARTAAVDQGGILVPANAGAAGAAVDYGYMGAAAAQATNHVHNGYAVPIQVNGAATNDTIATNATGTVKAFLHFC